MGSEDVEDGVAEGREGVAVADVGQRYGKAGVAQLR